VRIRRGTFRIFIILSLLAGLFSSSPDALAQKAEKILSGSIAGTVQDALGRPLSDVDVELQTDRGNLVARVASDPSGHFTFTGIKAGEYRIFSEKGGFHQGISAVSIRSASRAPVVIVLEAEAALNLKVAATRLDLARNSLSPTTGGSSYTFTQPAIEALPQGNNTPLNEVLLQAPGVVNDSYGQIHVRGDHADLQYRIDGIQLPEGMSGFANAFSTRFVNSLSLLTGALPAEFGLRTAGVVDIKTKTGTIAPGGAVDFYGGQHSTLEPSFELGGTQGQFSYYLTGGYTHSTRGLDPPTPGPSPTNDTTDQGRYFGDFSYYLSPQVRLTLLTGAAIANFEIPANSGETPAYSLTGVPYYPSIDVHERQLEQNYYNVLALQGSWGSKLDYQVAAFSRYSNIHFVPDNEGDLIYDGAASDVFRSSFVNGVQSDVSYRLPFANTARGGFYFSGENVYIGNHELVFPADSSGQQTSNVPFQIVDNVQITDWLYGGYLQDEWKPTEALTFNVGARFDLSDAFVRATQFSPRFGAVYKLPTGTTLHAAFARYFTPPQTEVVTDVDINKFKGTTGQPPTLYNSLPVPAREYNFDAGASQQVGKSLVLGVDGYYRMVRNLLDEGQFGPALVFTPINYQKGRIYGVEATSSFSLRDFTSYANFTYSVAQGTNVTSGQVNFEADELNYIANHYVFLDHDQTFTTDVGTTYRWRGFMFTVDSNYESGLRRGFANTGNMLPYFTANLGLTKRFELPSMGPFEARLAVINLFDHTYQIRNGTGIGVFAAQYGERRSIFGGLKWEIPFFNRNGSSH